jgi:hypothetical protein
MDGYSYDASGNLLNDGSHGYFYDAENRIIQVDGSAGYSATHSGTAATVEGAVTQQWTTRAVEAEDVIRR